MKRTKLPEHGDLRVGGGGGHACVKLCHRGVKPGQDRGGVNGQVDEEEEEKFRSVHLGRMEAVMVAR